ncbi:MAG: energy transducer TonB [Fibrobacterota bacterium]
MIRRSPDRVRHSPDWKSIPSDATGLAAPFDGAIHVPHSRIKKISTSVSVAAAVAFVFWLVLKAPGQGEAGLRPAQKSADVQVVSDVPPVPPPNDQVIDQEISLDRQLPTTSVPTPPQPPSVGLVGSGEMGGKGNGTPGLDLGIEGGGEGMAVAAGGGGKGNGAGSGVGNGVGSQRFIYQPGQVDQDAQPEKIVDAPYPRRAQEDGVEASVQLRMLIDERGRVEQTEVLGAPPGYGFDNALKTVVQQWRFKPARLGGVPVPQWVNMPYSFHL